MKMYILIAALAALSTAVRAAAVKQPAPDGEAYCHWVLGCIDAVGKDLPAITVSAEAAATLFVRTDYGISAYGDPGLVSEAVGRAGGLMPMQRPAARLIVLALPGEKTLSEDIARAIDQKKNGQFVVFFGRQAFIDAARVAGFQADSFINTHAGDNSTLLCGPDGVQALPTDPVAGMIGLWTWTGEFVSACTRLGKMPAMYQSFSVPGARERAKRLENLKFHPEIPHEMAPLAVGNEYLADLRKEVQALGTHQIGEIRKVAHLGSLARETGHSAYCFVTGHAIRDHVDVPHAPAIFKKISEGWGTLPKDARIGPGDVIFFVGYDCTFGPTAELRKQGVTLAWSFASYIDTVPRPEMERDIGKDEVFIDQGWGFGDAVAAIPGYDIKILPTSGILAETVLWMASAEAMALSPVRKE